MARRRLFSLLAPLVLLVAAPRSALAIAPPVLSDEALAKAPIVVLARWDPKGKIERHDDIEGNVMHHGEAHLELVVERSVFGDVAPGRHPLLLRHYGGLVWGDDGRPMTGMSTDLPGDVDDVRVPSLWFLDRRRSWDPEVKTDFLAPFGYHRSVQDPKYEAWYGALRPPAPDASIAPFLASPDPAIVLRALEAASGGIWPWPFRDDFDEWLRGKRDPAKVRRGLAKEVKGALSSKDAEVRLHALALLSDMAAPEALPASRPLLDDPDAGVRALAVALLAGAKDAAALPAFAKATRASGNGWIGRVAVERLAAWGIPETVPALVGFLDADETAGPAGEKRLLAVAAREALRQVAGYAFPYDVDASLAAWAEASKKPTRDDRIGFLRERLGDDADPLVARWPAAGPGDGASVEVLNRSARPVTLAKRPSEVQWQGGGGYSSHWLPPAEKADDFATIPPGGSLTVSLTGSGSSTSFFASPSSDEPSTLTLTFGRNGKALGLHAWVGFLVLRTPAPAKK